MSKHTRKRHIDILFSSLGRELSTEQLKRSNTELGFVVLFLTALMYEYVKSLPTWAVGAQPTQLLMLPFGMVDEWVPGESWGR